MKRLDLNSKITDLLAKTAGPDVDPNQIAVFEAVLINTKPLKKKGTIFDKARFTQATLQEMADYIAAGETVPLQNMHMSELPLGTVFFAEVYPVGDGMNYELRGLFYVPLENLDLVTKLDQGIINEVSIGVLNKHILCSECGFDYLGPDASITNLWDLTCNEDHTIGVDGIYAVLSGLDSWIETSLVNRGAGFKPKIVGKSSSKISETSLQRLAASGLTEQAVVLHTCSSSHHPSQNKENTNMDNDVLVQLARDLGTANAKLEASSVDVGTLNEAVAQLKAEKVDLTQKLEEALKGDSTGLQAKLDSATTDLATTKGSLTLASEFVDDLHTKVLTAAGVEIKDDLTLELKLEEIKTHQSKLSAVLPVGGRAKDMTEIQAGSEAVAKDYSAFKTAK